MTLAAQDLSLPGRLSGVSMELHRGAVTAPKIILKPQL